MDVKLFARWGPLRFEVPGGQPQLTQHVCDLLDLRPGQRGGPKANRVQRLRRACGHVSAPASDRCQDGPAIGGVSLADRVPELLETVDQAGDTRGIT